MFAPATPWVVGVAIAAFGGVLVAPRAANADSGENIVAVAGAGARVHVDNQGSWAGGAIGEFQRGISRSVWLRVSAGGMLSVDQPDDSAWFASTGLTYAFDVVRYVPYLHLGVGAAWLWRDGQHHDITPAADFASGIDFLANRTRSYGLVARVVTSFTNETVYTVGFRVAHRWGFF